METKLILELPNDPREIEHAVDFVMQRCATCRMRGRKLKFNLRVSLTEASPTPCCTGTAKTRASEFRSR